MSAEKGKLSLSFIALFLSSHVRHHHHHRYHSSHHTFLYFQIFNSLFTLHSTMGNFHERELIIFLNFNIKLTKSIVYFKLIIIILLKLHRKLTFSIHMGKNDMTYTLFRQKLNWLNQIKFLFKELFLWPFVLDEVYFEFYLFF